MAAQPPESSPAVFKQAQRLLAPFIKSRQEVSQIRRVLTAHLAAQIEHEGVSSLAGCPSLVYSSDNVKTPSGPSRGLRKEYLRNVRANAKARREYNRISNQHLSEKVTEQSSQNLSSLEPFLKLVKHRQRHERLRILQDYIGSLARKSASVAPFQMQEASASISRLPSDVFVIANSAVLGSSKPSPTEILSDLERAVLKAKVQLKKETQLIMQIKNKTSERLSTKSSPSSNGQTLKALGGTRNELIAWIEEELGKAGEPQPQINGTDGPGSGDTIEAQLSKIHTQYGHYIQLRKQLLDVVSSPTASPSRLPAQNSLESDVAGKGQDPPMLTLTIAPYLEDLITTSNEQKSLIMQRSFLTVTLAKKQKEILQTFDRLTDESHLLPAFPLPSSMDTHKGYGLSATFADDMAGRDIPPLSRRARAWTFAADGASMATKESVLRKVEEVSLGVEEAQQALSSLGEMIAGKISHVGVGDGDIWMSDTSAKLEKPARLPVTPGSLNELWSLVDGRLGVIKHENEN